MYSRFPGKAERPIRIPEHYSGCAFPPKKPESQAASASVIPLPSYAAPNASEKQPTQESDEKRNDATDFRSHNQTDSAHTPDQKKDSSKATEAASVGSFPLLGKRISTEKPLGLSFEELLLIGLIILLSHSDLDSDIIPWLALLLFYK